MKCIFGTILLIVIFAAVLAYFAYRPIDSGVRPTIQLVSSLGAHGSKAPVSLVFSNAFHFDVEFHTVTFPVVPGKGNVLQEGVIPSLGTTNIQLALAGTNAAFCEVSYRRKRTQIVHAFRSMMLGIQSRVAGRQMREGWEGTVRSNEFYDESELEQGK